ncbi:PadR family transcriptional regulator [Agromyces sp. CFH 90414]|uniref:PadR family transcriptional regulator n=1 Tax=Agromyces agglutinans TaxID=2662258 RepID=A0A6I2F7D2_9MICO|nr:helix-turn-helix transcriptional regulator [Agromyces agglutinans]MRG58336.1 PadR family transcriptional regulator [Agromyces agglutinans]
MAVRDALVALLTAGPAYGFQLHGELAARTGARREINVGQTYATLDRLTSRRLIEPAGSTDDGLPLHRLTDAGRDAAAAWLGGADASGTDPWDETVDRVLIAASLPGTDLGAVLAGERARWMTRRDDSAARAAAPAEAAGDGLARLAAAAEVQRADAALGWLAAVEHAAPAPFAPSADRPRRGRRPGSRAAAAGVGATSAGEPDESGPSPHSTSA